MACLSLKITEWRLQGVILWFYLFEGEFHPANIFGTEIWQSQSKIDSICLKCNLYVNGNKYMIFVRKQLK